MLYIFDHYLVGFRDFLFPFSEEAWVVNCWKLFTTDHKRNSTDMDSCLNTNLKCYNFQIPFLMAEDFTGHLVIILPWSLVVKMNEEFNPDKHTLYSPIKSGS